MPKYTKDWPPTWSSNDCPTLLSQRDTNEVWEVIERHRSQAAWIGFLQGFATAAGIAAIAFLVLR